MRHHQLWKRARYIVGGRWQYSCISLLLSHQFSLWRWEKGRGPSVLVGDGSTYTVRMARVPVTLPVFMVLEEVPPEDGEVYVGLAPEQADPPPIVAWLESGDVIDVCTCS